jgi:hypothetical protein
MTAPPGQHKARAANAGSAEKTKVDAPTSSKTVRPAQQVIATINKSRSCELRVSLTSWRGDNKVELRDAVATIPGIFFPTGAGVTLPLDKLSELLTALCKAEDEARKAGRL